MKKILIAIILLSSQAVLAIEGYQDIYIDRDRDIIIHGIVCAPDLKKPSHLKPSYVFTNTNKIEKGTYFYNSPYGNYSLTFNTTKNPAIMARGLLQKGQTKKEQMAKNVCIVSSIKGLPSSITNNINTFTLKANDSSWDKVMTKYTFVSGKPAYGKDVFQDNRTTAKFDKADKIIFDANQKYLKKIEKLFSSKYKKLARKLPKKFKSAIKYAHKQDGFAVGKVYPSIKEPAVWTPIAKERYNNLSRQRGQRIEWDNAIQANFNWLFGLTGKDNLVKSTRLISKTKPQWNGVVLEQIATVQATFKNGKSLELDFLITSSKVNASAFDSMETIKKKAYLIRNNPIASSKKPRAAIKMPTKKSITVYSPAEKEIIFFSPFKQKGLGDSYRYQ